MYYEAANHIRDQLSNTGQKLFFISKIVIVISVYIILIFSNQFNFIKPVYQSAPECMNDHLYNQLEPINKVLRENVQLKNAIIITAGLIMDLLFLIISIRFICFHKNCRLLATLVVFYLIRGIIQNMFSFGMPNDYIWGFPGMYSLVVSYYPINDFFYSGHVGSCLISYLEFRRDGCHIMKKIAFSAIFIEAFVLLVTRAHYSIDLIGGVVFAHYLYIIIGGFFSDKSLDESIPSKPRESLVNSIDTFKNLLNARISSSSRLDKAHSISGIDEEEIEEFNKHSNIV